MRGAGVDVDVLEQFEHVSAKPRQEHVTLEVKMLDLLFELRPQLTLAEDDEPDVGDHLDDDGRRLDQRVVVLLNNQRANGYRR